MSYDLSVRILKEGVSVDEMVEAYNRACAKNDEIDYSQYFSAFSGAQRNRIIRAASDELGWGACRRRSSSMVGEHVELTLPDDAEDLGITVTLFDDEIGIAIAYWYDGEDVLPVLEVVEKILAIIAREERVLFHDSQLGVFFTEPIFGADAPGVFTSTRERLAAWLASNSGENE